MDKIELKLHTVVLLIGPTNSGKSFFSKNHLIPAIQDQFRLAGSNKGAANITYLSSDDIRRELLGDPGASKYDRRMMQVSEKAFKTLHQRLDTAMEWPHNSHVIVVDTTGLNNDFRKKVVQQARTGQYNVAAVIFDYKTADEYLLHVPSELQDKRILHNHLDKLRKEVWKTINKDLYDQIFRVKSKDFAQYPVTIDPRQLSAYESCFLSPKREYDIIGDVHGCWEELKELLLKRGYKFETDGLRLQESERGLVFVGDLIDKGPDSRKLVEFAHINAIAGRLELVLGNHENFVYKYLLGKIQDSGMPEEVRKTYFSSTEEFAGDKELLEKLGTIVALSSPFLSHQLFTVTHAPCQAKYIGKLDGLSVKMQSGRFRMPRRGEADTPTYIRELETFFSYIKTEAVFNAPFHMFGHVMFRSGLHLKNKIGLDTGCVAGGKLTCVSVAPYGKPYFSHVSSKQPAGEELIDIFKTAPGDRKIDLLELEPREYGRVMWTARDKIAFVSGTIAPAEASPETNEIEPLFKALEYYRNKGCQRVILEPKYMGSRCNVYLNRDTSKSFAVSRNGFRIKHVDLNKVFADLRKEFDIYFRNGTDLLVLDGELMPWAALGAGLIDEQYKVVEAGLRTEFEELRAAGFEKALESLYCDRSQTDFVKDMNEMKKEELYKKYGQARGHSYRVMDDLIYRSLDEEEAFLAVYAEQIRLFGSPAEPSYKAFAILKSVNMDGTERNYQANGQSNIEQFEIVSEDQYCTVDLESPEDVRRAHAFFRQITNQDQMEGVVVKPEFVTNQMAPALKVRGLNYLTLIYGYDYRCGTKLKRLIAGKRTGRKMRTSMQEFEIGQKMLAFRQDEITEQNQDYLQLVAAMVLEEKSERALDPRL